MSENNNITYYKIMHEVYNKTPEIWLLIKINSKIIIIKIIKLIIKQISVKYIH